MSDKENNLRAIMQSPSYLLAEQDTALLARAELRPVRLQLELLKPEMAFQEHGIDATIVVFGSTQISQREQLESRLQAAQQALAAQPNDAALAREVSIVERLLAKAHYYDAAREFARLVATEAKVSNSGLVIVTGGGPGIMEAANRGAHDVGAKSVGLNITLPSEQLPNPYITPGLCFRFHYFALRKMHFLLRAKALVAFPGGFGTLDEVFDALTLRQTTRMQEIPVIMYGRDYWRRVIDFQFLADEGAIDDTHLRLINYADSPQEAWDHIARFHQYAP
ncbi:MAG: TIGR00730 family Rossman fold protein [Pirellulales bacterium]